MPDTNTTTTTPSSPVTPRTLANAQPLSGLSSSQASTSVISKALRITGQLESTENIQIEGEVDGDIRAASVKVGANAKVKGSVYGEEVEVAGTVDGKIEARKVVLTRTAHMSGDVIHQDITIESGAYMAGHCRPEFGKSETKSAPLSYKSASAPREHAMPEKPVIAAAEKSNGAAAAKI